MNRVEEFAAAEQRYFARLGFAPRSQRLQLDRPRLQARVIEAGEGGPVLYLHGGGSCAAFWASLAMRLPGRALLVDRPGFGLSDAFSYRGVDLKQHALDFLGSTLDALKLPSVRIVANSMGGLWALWLAIAQPERVSSLALLGCPALLLDTSAPFPMRLLSVPGVNRLMLALERPGPANARRSLVRLGSDPSRLPTEALELAMAMQQLPSHARAFATLLERALRPGGARLPFSAADLERVRQPVLFVWGRRDPFGGPDVGERACRVLLRGRIAVVDGGHLPWIDAPDECADLLRAFH